MQLPHADDAVVPLEKITGYLLNEAHPDGRGKAAYFRRLGFRREEPVMLQEALLRLAREADMTETVFAFGVKYVAIRPLVCSDGRRASVLSV